MKEVPAQVGEAPADQPRVLRAFRIPVRYAGTLLLRGLVIWVLARFMVVALYLFIAASARRDFASEFTQINPAVLAGWTLALSVTLLRVDLHRRHEVALLNNLGVMTSQALMLGAVPAIVLEAAMAVLR